MKKILAVFLALLIIVHSVPFASAGGTAYTVQRTPVIEKDEQTGSLNLRFYTDMPHVPCLGIREYLGFVMETEVTVSQPDEDTWEFTRSNGACIRVNPDAGTVSSPDWESFQILPVSGEKKVGVEDSPCPWYRYMDLFFDDEPNAVLFDFAKYGIRIHADAEDVYLPLAMLSSLFIDSSYNYLLYNGEKIFKPELNLENIAALPAGYYESERMRALLNGEAQREEDEIRESYGELCFLLDYFFGHPGIAPLDGALAEKGLEGALRDMPDGEGEAIREELLSPDMAEYLTGMSKLFFLQLDDGHTAFSGISDLIDGSTPYFALALQIMSGVGAGLIGNSAVYRQLLLLDPITRTRAEAWGDEAYREYGSTAIIRIDNFYPDKAGWLAYYTGEGEIPADSYGIAWIGLKRASENPAIKNILFDLSANVGGDSDVLMAIMDLAAGEDTMRLYNALTGQHERVQIHTDRNLDGVIDEKDKEVKYDFNYGVLTTRLSFSCGNLFPIMMQEHGAVLLGEPSGGGSCSVQIAVLSSGAVFMMSSAVWTFRDQDDESVEDGCRTDLLIERTEKETTVNMNPRLSPGDYAPFFDDEMLDKMMNEWFAPAEEAPAA